jgi:teichuronic acid exporter
LKFLKSIVKSDTFTLSAGTIIAQLVLFIVTPILSRIYLPEAFGSLSIFVSFCTILSIIISLRLESAIIIPKAPSESWALVLISLSSSLLLGLLTLVVMGIYRVKEPIYYLIPLASFFIAGYNNLILVLHRNLRYKEVAVFTVLYALFVAILNLIFGKIYPEHGLVIAFGLSYVLMFGSMSIYLYRQYSSDIKSSIPFFSYDFFKNYSHFPKYLLWYALLNTISMQVVPLIFNSLYSKEIVGYYSLATRLMRAPFLVFVGAIGNIYKNEAMQHAHAFNQKLLQDTYKKNFFLLLGIGCFMLLPIAYLSPIFFSYFLGTNWVIAGYFAQIMVVGLVTEIVEIPLSFIFTLYKKQNIQLYIQIISFVFSVSGLYIGYVVYNDASLSLLFYSISYCITNIISIYLSYNLVSNERLPG